MSKTIEFRRLSFLIALLMSATQPAQAGGFYKCVDANGEIQYQRVACAKTAKQEKMHVYLGPGEPSELSHTAYTPEGEEPALADTYLFLPHFSSALSSLTPAKTAVARFYLTHGTWPEDLKDLGFSDKAMHSSQIEEVLLGGEGAIVARLNPSFGNDKRLVLRPATIMDGTSLEWRCQANFPAEALNVNGVGLCESRALR
jgi:hypothetical protein